MPYAYVTNLNAGTVSVINTSTNAVSDTITIGGAPFGVAITPDATEAYITNQNSGTVQVVNTSTNTLAATITVGSFPRGIDIAPDNRKAYVANYTDNTVSVIDITTKTVLATIGVGTAPVGVAVTPDGAKVYVANATSSGSTLGKVSVIDTASDTISSTITVGYEPWGVALSPDGGTAYVVNSGGSNNNSTVSVIDTSNDTVSATIFLASSGGPTPLAVAVTPNGDTIYVTGQTVTYVIDASTNTVSTSIPGGGYGLCITSDGAEVYVANTGAHNVLVIDTATNTVTATIAVGNTPTAFGKFIQPASIPMTSIYAAPQGRLTLTSNTPVMTADALAATSVYYTPYQGNIVPVYDGANMQSYTFGQLTMALNSSNQTSGHIYDLFAFLNSSVVTIGAGPAWSSSTSRGTGAGTTELQQIDGLWVNANTITLKNGSTTYSNIPVGQATYLGSVYMTANGQTQFNIKPAAASGGTNNIVGTWNAYNRVSLKTLCRDSSGYTYATNTWRKADNNANNRISFLDGLGQSSVAATFINSVGTATASAQVYIGINLNSTSATPNLISFAASPTSTLADNYTMLVCEEAFPPALGFNYYQAMENSVSSVTATFNALGKDLSLILDCEY